MNWIRCRIMGSWLGLTYHTAKYAEELRKTTKNLPIIVDFGPVQCRTAIHSLTTFSDRIVTAVQSTYVANRLFPLHLKPQQSCDHHSLWQQALARTQLGRTGPVPCRSYGSNSPYRTRLILYEESCSGSGTQDPMIIPITFHHTTCQIFMPFSTRAKPTWSPVPRVTRTNKSLTGVWTLIHKAIGNVVQTSNVLLA